MWQNLACVADDEKVLAGNGETIEAILLHAFATLPVDQSISVEKRECEAGSLLLWDW